jgi:hypothetical protein
MKTSALVVATAGVTTVAVAGILYASQVASQPRSLDLAVYTPIGVVQTPTGTQTIAWVLDATNRRVVMCSQKLNEINTAKIECRSGDLPSY